MVEGLSVVVSNENKELTAAGLFAGIGGLCHGLELAGFKNLWATDFDEEVATTYRHNYPQSDFIHADINELDFDSAPAVDVLHGGFPCQSFSQAGNRKGFDDPRGQLFVTMMNKIAAMKNKPKVLLFENSPNIKNGENGAWFSHIVFSIRKAGYRFSAANCFELDAREHAGSPQSRVRLFMIAFRKDLGPFNPFLDLSFKAPSKPLETLLQRGEVRDPYYYLNPENKYSRMIKSQANAADDSRIFQLRKTVVRVQNAGVCPTLTANMGAGGHNVPFIFDHGEVRKLTERECLRLQSFPEEFAFPDSIKKTSRYRMIGNAVNAGISQGIGNYLQNKLREALNEPIMEIPA